MPFASRSALPLVENDRRPALNSAHLGKAARAALFGTALGLAGSPLLLQAAESTPTHQAYAIAPGQLNDVLNQFARQAGITLSSTPQLTGQLQSNGLQGQYSPGQGLHMLLQGTGLEAVSQDGRSYVIQPQADSAALSLPSTDVRGFSLGNALGSMDGYNATHSQVATKTSTPLVETSQSVSVVTRQQMDDQGAQTVAQAMRYTPGVLTNPYGATHRL